MQLRVTFLHFILFFVSACFSLNVQAHEVRPAIIDLDIIDSGNLQVTIKLNLEALVAQIDSQSKNTNDDKNAALYNQLRRLPATDLAKRFDAFAPYFKDHIFLQFKTSSGIKKAQFTDLSSQIPEVGDTDLARDSIITFKGTLPADATSMQWHWDKQFGNAALRVSTPQNKEHYSAYLLDGKSSDLIPIPSVQEDHGENGKKVGGCTSFNCKWKVFINYLEVGYVHILPLGLDHILFVVGLFLLSANLRPLLIQITTFTLAHSFTLALGIYGIVSVPSAIVEPLIAASIIFICIENIYANHLSPWRPVVVFFFGLLHGLGFASVLREIGLSSENFVTGLVAFNIGVELGQLTVIAFCFLAVGIWFRNEPWYRQRITIPASIVIAIIAAFWFAERVNWV